MRISQREGVTFIAWLLILSIVSLILQLLPIATWQSAWYMMNLRNWTAGIWFTANALLFLGLLAARFGSELRAEGRGLMAKMARRRPTLETTAKKERKLRADEERKLYKRMEEARKRQVV